MFGVLGWSRVLKCLVFRFSNKIMWFNIFVIFLYIFINLYGFILKNL